MREYLTQAIILERESQGELDCRITVWSREFGRLRGRAVSLRKITSKLSAHLEPGMLSQLRLVENKNLQVVDALKIKRLEVTPHDIHNLSRLLKESEPEEELWTAITLPQWSWVGILAVLGWDPRHASCSLCSGLADAFSVNRQEFFCAACASKLLPDALVYM
jgi:recombinational DNA repair protein (RecF pathway)